MPESLLTLFYSLFKQCVPADVLFSILFPSTTSNNNTTSSRPTKSGLPDLGNLRALSSNLSSAKLSTENLNNGVAVNSQTNATSIQNDSLAVMLEQTKKINASLNAPLFGKK